MTKCRDIVTLEFQGETFALPESLATQAYQEGLKLAQIYWEAQEDNPYFDRTAVPNEEWET